MSKRKNYQSTLQETYRTLKHSKYEKEGFCPFRNKDFPVIFSTLIPLFCSVTTKMGYGKQMDLYESLGPN